MTIGELLKILTQEAIIYRKHCVNSIDNNRHMNNCHGDCKITQDEVDAVLVSYINNIGIRRGVDYALYTEDLENK